MGDDHGWHVDVDVTELDLARANLRQMQESLAIARRMRANRFVIQFQTLNVLAALSWVWDAQERAGAAPA
jgi:hypothetical protein